MLQFPNNSFLYVLKVMALSLLASSCAQVVAPGGGKRDNDPPKIVKYSPDSAQLNFNSNTIELTFDEYIQLKDLNNQLLISPPLATTPDFKVKNKTLTITLDKTELKPNTTYSINFGNALQDINENNPNENFSYIFSTGSFIDSLKVKGKVQTAFDHKAEKGIFVMLYANMDDSAVYKAQPDYFAKTTADGSFQVNNIRQGKYKIVALKDANAHYKYDGDAENIGFSDTLVDPAEKKEIKLDLFKERANKIFVKRYMNPTYGKITIMLNEGSDSIRVTNITNDQKGVQEFVNFSKNRDTITYWVKNYTKDSLKLRVSNGNVAIDTLEFKMITLEDALKSKRNPLKLSVVRSPGGNQEYDLGGGIYLNFSNPINNISLNNKIEFKEDTSLFRTNYHPSFIYDNMHVEYGFLDSSNTITELPDNPGVAISAPVFTNFTLKENTKYHLFIPPGTFTDIFGLKNDSIKLDFKTREAKYYGSLKLKVNVAENATGKYIVQLLDDREAVVREDFISKTETLTYNYLHPNKYHLKMIYDANGNWKWDSGDYLKKIQPERVIFNPETITIRSNWDAEIEWQITR
ncbi:MAG: hypothetical protein JWO09_3338 [Bacteroidetes bacterium]|nr:hypothetical protein [Bacteroidota bacterium]